MIKSKHEYHDLYRIFPAMDLADHAWFAFSNAAEHLRRIRELLESRGMQTLWEEDKTLDERTKAERQGEVNSFHRHLRSFLWELVASFDTMLQWANQEYQLGVQEHVVRFAELPTRAGKNQGEWDRKYALLEGVWNSDWYFEVRAYRNFAHRAFGNVQTAIVREPGGDRALVAHLFPVRKGQREYVPIQEHLSSYLENMRRLGLAFFPNMAA